MKTLRKILLLLVTVLLAAGCGKIGDIHLTGYKVAAISPVGLRGLDVALNLGIDNPAMQFTVCDITAEVFRDGRSVGIYTSADPVTVKARTVGTYRLDGRIQLSDGVSLMQVLGYVSKFEVDRYTLSYGATVKLKSGARVKLQKKNVPLKELFEDNE